MSSYSDSAKRIQQPKNTEFTRCFSRGLVIFKCELGGWPLLSLTGAIHTIFLGLLIVLVFLNPVAAGTSTGVIGLEAIATILLGLLASILFYPVAMAIRKRAGLDLDLALQQIPPE